MRPDKPIVVVEDNPDDQFLINQAFRLNRVRNPVQLLANASEAISYLMGEAQFADRERFPYPSALITDLKMEGGDDGFDLLEHLRLNPGFSVVPTVVLSSSDDPEDIRVAYLLGAHGYHVKPTGFEDLRRLLAHIYAYWNTCSAPNAEKSGKQIIGDKRERLGQRFPEPSGAMQRKPAGSVRRFY